MKKQLAGESARPTWTKRHWVFTLHSYRGARNGSTRNARLAGARAAIATIAKNTAIATSGNILGLIDFASDATKGSVAG
jgi:hypothetical protein